MVPAAGFPAGGGVRPGMICDVSTRPTDVAARRYILLHQVCPGQEQKKVSEIGKILAREWKNGS